MADIQDKIAQAKAAGYSDAEISQHLASSPDFGAKIKKATDAGYSNAEIIAHLSGGASGKAADQIPTDNYKAGPAADHAPAPDVSKDNLLQRALGTLEAPVAMATGAVGGVVGPIVGAAKNVISGKYGSQQGVQEADKTAADIASRLTYQPRTQTGNKLVQMAGNALNDSGVIAVAPMVGDMAALGRGVAAGRGVTNKLAAASGDAMAAQDAAALAPSNRLAGLIRADKPTMAGGGAAATAEATQRVQRAANMPVPIKLTKGQAERTFDDTQFEREAAKTPEGKAINDRYAEQNQQMAQNMDAFADETGAQASGLRATGKAVTDAIAAKKDAAKSQVNAAYTAARDAGDMEQPVSYKPLSDYLAKHDTEATVGNASMLSAVKDKLGKLDPDGTGMISINDMEELRKMAGRLTAPGTPNSAFIGDVKGLMDKATEGQGGTLYQQARRMNENYANQFADRDVIDKLMRNKPGTKDRAVAYEDVMKHTLLNGSLDDVKHVFRTLEAHPVGTDPAIVEQGMQAGRELRGSLMNHIKETMFSNSGADVLGNTVGSAAKIEKLVRELDKDGKLEAIYGKQGAQKIRDAKDLAVDLYTSPSGTVNSSNNANRIVSALNKASQLSSGVPLVRGVVKYAAKRAESNELSKRVDAALNPPANRLQSAAQP